MRAGARPELSPDDGARPRAADLLAKSPKHNLCGKIWSHYDAKLDENRTYTLTNSTIMYNIKSVCHLAVISPTDPPRAGAHHHREKVRAALPALIFAAVSTRFP